MVPFAGLPRAAGTVLIGHHACTAVEHPCSCQGGAIILFHRWGNWGMSHSSKSINTEHSLQHPSYRQHPHSKDADKYWQTRYFYFNQCNANKFWKTAFLKTHSSTGHKQPNVNWQRPVKGKHLHTLKLKMYPYQELAYSRCLHKNWEGLSLVT